MPLAASLVTTPLLVRTDAGFCSLKLMASITAHAKSAAREMAFIIKWNPRKTPVESLASAMAAGAAVQWTQLRDGKRECVWQETLDLACVGNESNPARRVYRLTERTIDKRGNTLHRIFKRYGLSFLATC